MTEQAAVAVHRNESTHRFEAELDGTVVGYVRYRTRPGQVVLIHTETFPEYEGRGIGGALARGALDDIRARGERAVLVCPFITSYVANHPEYQDLVASPG
jgi:predicted GNAT family acetyltransferase